MRCPLCPDSVLVVSHRHGIEVDHCPTCRGVWLDRGELDHLVESVAERLGAGNAGSERMPPAPAPAGPPPGPSSAEEYSRGRGAADTRWDDRRRSDDQRGRKKNRRKHAVLDLLEEVLDL